MSNLLNTARALDDHRFLWRVRAAVLTTARAKIGDSDAAVQGFSRSVLDNPMAENRTIEALVASGGRVADSITVDEYNTVNTEGVPDADILLEVGEVWGIAATRWSELRSSPTTTP